MGGQLFYGTGAAARQLNTSADTIRRLVAAGSIPSETTPGGQVRISSQVVEELRRTGLPATPRPLPDDNPSSGPVKPRHGHPELLGPPSNAVVDAREQVDIAAQQVEIRRHKVERLKLHKEAVELGDFFRARRREREQEADADREWAETQARAERERAEAELQAERAQQEAIRAQQRRREWMNEWLAFAVHAPHSRWEWRDARNDVDVGAAIHDEVLPILERTSSDEPDRIVKALVLAAVERVIASWQRGRDIQQIYTSAGTDWLPYGACGTSAGLSMWQVRSMEAAAAAMGGLRADASVEELRCVAKEAARKIAAAFDHIEEYETLVRDLGAQVQGASADELAAAEKEVQKALSELPRTASQRDRESARDGAITSLRQRIAARLAAYRAEAQAKQQQIEDRATRQELCRLGPWILPWDFPADQNPPATVAVSKALDALPEGTPQRQLEQARTAALAPFIAAHAQRKRKEEIVAGGLREVLPLLIKLE